MPDPRTLCCAGDSGVLTARRPDRRTLAAFAVTVAIGGVNSIAVRINLRELTPFWGAAFRFAIASVALALIVLLFHRRRPARANLLGIFLFGLFNFGLTYVFLYTGLRDAPAGTTAVITALVPLLTLIFAVLQRVERFRPAGLVGSLIAVAGIALIFANQVSLNVPIQALLSLIGAAACIAETGVLVKRFPPGDPLIAMALAVPIGAIFLGILSAVVGEPWIIPSRPETWATIAYLVVLGSIVIVSLTLFVLQHWTASATSYAFMLSPLVSIILGALILGEKVQPAFVAGGALVLAGVYVGAVFRPRGPKSSSEVSAATVADNPVDHIPAAH
jgi:drug/metabolite transporter (DMT)-like permease